MTSTLESSDNVTQGLGAPTTFTPDNNHTVGPERAPVDAPQEHELSAVSNTVPQGTPENTPEEPSIPETAAETESTGQGNQSDNEDQDEDDDDSDNTDEDSDDDFPRFEDAPRGRVVKPVSGQKPPKPPK